MMRMTAPHQPFDAPPRPPPSELDRLTLERARRGDRAAQEAFVRRYERPVFAVLSRMLGASDRALVEDHAQETFLRALAALPGFTPDGPAKLSTWVLTIASRLAIDTLRKRRVTLVSLDAAADVPSSTNPRIDIDAVRRRDAVDRAISTLPDAQRIPLVLFSLHALSIRDIALALDVEEGTVKSRLSRAKDAIRAHMTLEHP